MTNTRPLRRFLILAAVFATAVLADGIILAATGGLRSDATPVFPVLGGSFAKTRNSGTSLIIIGVLFELVVVAAWVVMGRRARRTQGDSGRGQA